MTQPASIVIPLTTVDPSLERVGGKGQSLSKLACAGLPVPAGFLLTTDAYTSFVRAHALEERIHQLASQVSYSDPATAERCSEAIRQSVESAAMTGRCNDAIVKGYDDLCLRVGQDNPSVAVRSSATAEDLPEMSFAGQQDTFLNVRGVSPLLDAIRGCWASLWSARAMLYRMKMGIDHRTVAMGVVVQVMVDADVSGILFTANPHNGKRDELVVNASYGLGESVVSGSVTPDTFVLSRDGLQIKESSIGSKEHQIRPQAGHGITTSTVTADERSKPSIPGDQLVTLAGLTVRAEQLFDGVPQDIEWAVCDGKHWLLQSRPITHLPAPPLGDVRWDPPAKGTKLIRRQIVEHMPGPLSQLFEQLYLQEGLETSIDQFFTEFALPVKMDDFIDRPMFLTVNGYAYCRANYRFTWSLFWVYPRIVLWYCRWLPHLLREAIPHWNEKALPAYQRVVSERSGFDPKRESSDVLLGHIEALATADAVYWFDVSMVVATAKITDAMLNRFVRSWLVPGRHTSGEYLRGFPSKTIEVQSQLEAIADQIRASEPLRTAVTRCAPAGVVLALKNEPQGIEIADQLDRYIERFGHQIYSLDFAVPTQGEDPMPILISLQELVRGDSQSSRKVQSAIAREREQLVQQTAASLGPIRRWIFRKLFGWAVMFGPHREEALFYMGIGWPTLRRFADELGTRLADCGTIDRSGDLYHLTKQEICEACAAQSEGETLKDFGDRARQRRELRDSRQHLHPPGMVPEKAKFKLGPINMSMFETQKRNDQQAQTLDGFPVSPGSVTGVASVILSPSDFAKMQAGTILVCPTTTPAWTPLFSQATGLVTEIGGILAHGSIVSREYGIPAVMGTGNITQRITSGTRITVDGDRGIVTIHDD